MTQQPTTPVLSQDIVLACVDPWGRNVDVPTTLGYRHSDPYAITLTFHSAVGDVEWIADRMLLHGGLAGRVGDGDIRLYPSYDADARPVTVLDFCSPDGRLIAEAGTDELRTFLARTFAVVPSGTEADHLDLDALIADLLDPAE